MEISLAKKDRAASVADEIERKLLIALAGINVQSVNTTIIIEAKAENGALAGGVAASTSYGWLLVKTLWVHEDHRGSGLGRQLMAAAEAEGLASGCHSAWLDTSNSDAREFYLKLGYSDFGILMNGRGRAPEGHARWFMKRDLTPTL